ncbi:LOG family protein [Leptothoe kymatousa]|uniref:LOG family protein n=1 Tax=Leptothoe kymatousa TAU-MAC 1615 TaxID=2364775 RepID=A0ABS5XYM6_9CYAN|nr:LOG family protein [Leptothoe kymatousa]MBT9310731.1 LOG family protein [Leptothoe kymatousa TAU-MAC 1615]
MVTSAEKMPTHLQEKISEVVTQLPSMEHGAVIQQILETLVRMIGREADRLDWKILNNTLQDMELGFQGFYPHRHTRKIAIFGSARTSGDHPDYQLAKSFAQRAAKQGFMVMTGAGPGIMEAGNEGAGADHSFGLNIQLPFEQGSNPIMENDPKLLTFKYFFTRKLFFLRECDALTVFPGGFGTQDEAFESLTLVQTGKAEPMPIVLIDHPGGNYWQGWDTYVRDHLLANGLISSDDPSLYVMTDNIDDAWAEITNYYRVFHSIRYVGDRLVIRLKSCLRAGALDELNQSFGDIVEAGKMEMTETLPEEQGDETAGFPRIVFRFNHRNFGRLQQFIRQINSLGEPCEATEHPEHK